MGIRSADWRMTPRRTFRESPIQCPSIKEYTLKYWSLFFTLHGIGPS